MMSQQVQLQLFQSDKGHNNELLSCRAGHALLLTTLCCIWGPFLSVSRRISLAQTSSSFPQFGLQSIAWYLSSPSDPGAPFWGRWMTFCAGTTSAWSGALDPRNFVLQSRPLWLLTLGRRQRSLPHHISRFWCAIRRPEGNLQGPPLQLHSLVTSSLLLLRMALLWELI